jgi:hypothetical protein
MTAVLFTFSLGPIEHFVATSPSSHLANMANATPIQVVYVIIGVLAVLPIYFGSFASLKVSFPDSVGNF